MDPLSGGTLLTIRMHDLKEKLLFMGYPPMHWRGLPTILQLLAVTRNWLSTLLRAQCPNNLIISGTQPKKNLQSCAAILVAKRYASAVTIESESLVGVREKIFGKRTQQRRSKIYTQSHHCLGKRTVQGLPVAL